MKYSLWIILILILIFRFFCIRPNFGNGQLLKISGRVYSEPIETFGKLNFNLSGIRVSLKTNEEIHYGDNVLLKGEYKDGKIINGKIVEIKYSQGIFENIRKKLIYFYKSNLAEPHASLVAGVTIGAKSNLSKNLSDRLKNTGTSHIVVASGTNVTMFGGFILNLFLNFISRKKAVLLTIVSIWFYTFIAGLEAPIVRAAIMASVAFAGQGLGRVVNTLRLTFLAGFVMLFFVPRWITDVGFLLSFSTTISIVVFGMKLNSLFRFVPEFLREDLSTSLAAYIGSSPLIFYFFGNFNLLAPIYNLLVLWTVPIIMIIGGVSGIISFVFPELARFLLQLTLPLTAWFVTIVGI